jgi:hypothetical protein
MRKILRSLEKELIAKSNIISLEECTFGVGVGKSEMDFVKSLDLPNQFYEDRDLFWGYKLKWKTNHGCEFYANGSINILEIPQIFGDWEGITFLPSTPSDSDLRDFKIVDYYLSEYACGIFWGNRMDLIFHKAELDGSKPLSLDLDVTGYIEMFIASKGYIQWQTAIEFILYGTEKSNVDDFKAHMPILFPDWTWEAFVQKFEEVRLHSVK